MVAKQIDLLAIVGPTASGKTALGIDIAKKFNGEIIACDSRTTYKYLDIGTAKPTKKEQQEVKHWGLDLVGPREKFNVAQFKSYAEKVILDIKKRNKLPILVGGTGLYVDAVLYDFTFVEPEDKERQKLQGLSVDELQKLIKDRGMEMPENIKNKRHLISALLRNGKHPQKKNLSETSLVIGLDLDKEILEARITDRAKIMVKQGVLDEIYKVAELYSWNHEAMSAGIYKVMRSVIENKESLDEGLENFVKSDKNLAKRQMTWFRRNKDIKWFKSTIEAKAWLETVL